MLEIDCYIYHEEFTVLRNPNPANLFHRIDYIEKMGTGIRRIQKMMQEAALPPVRYEWDDFVTVIFPLEEVKTSEKTSEKTSGKIIEIIRSNRNVTIKELSGIIGISKRSVERNLQKMQKDEKIRRIGPDRGGYWIIVNSE